MRIAVSPLFALTFAAGCVDAISFVGFGSVFTANMTGNTVLLGIAIAGVVFLFDHSAAAVLFAIAVISFAMGAQSLVAARAGRPGIATTYVTGTIVTAIARGFAHDAKDEHRLESIHNVWIWFVYCAGGAGGALLCAVFQHAGLLPLALIFVVIAFWVDLRGRHYAAQS